MKRVMLVFVSAAVLAASTRALGQGGQGGTIAGHVFDQTGNPLRGVRVVASSPTQIGGSRTAYSDEEGRFRLPALFPGKFEVRATAQNLRDVIQRNVQVGINETTELDLFMEVAAGLEEVKVIEKPPVVNTTSAQLKETFDMEFVESLPHDSRDTVHSQMVNAVPGAMSGRVRGGAANQTLLTQDGFEMRGQYPTMKAAAAYEISAGGHAGENPTASGAIVNLVTRSGSNKFEFDFNATAEATQLRFFRDQTDSRLPNHYYVLNPAFSGPIIKDRLWYHFNVETHLQERGRDGDVQGYLPDPEAWKRVIHKGIGKLTWQVSPRSKLSSVTNFDYVYDQNRRDGLGILPEAQEGQIGWRWFEGLTFESVLTDTLVLRSQVGGIYIPYERFPSRCLEDKGTCDHVPAEVQTFPRRQEYGNNPTHERDDLYSVQLNNRLEWFAGSKRLGEHGVQLSSRWYWELDRRHRSRPGDRLIEYQGTEPLWETTYFSNDPRLEPARYGWHITSHTVHRHMLSLTDAWRVTRHLTLNPALTHVWASAGNNVNPSVMSTSALVPALSGAWDPMRDGRTVLRGSFSVYVDVDLANVARHDLGGQVQQRCGWNAAARAFDRDCVYSGGASRNTFGRPCGPTGVGPDGRSCQESLKIPKTWEYALGAQREVVQGVAISLDGVYRRFVHQYETRETNRIWNASGSALMPTGAYRTGRAETVLDMGTPDRARRTYAGLTFGVHKREGRLKLQGSYTLATLFGNVFDGFSNQFGDIPPRDVYLDGPLPQDRRYEAKVLVQYQLAKWLGTGVRYYYYSGLPYSRTFRNAETGVWENYAARVGWDPGADINSPHDDRPLRTYDRQFVNVQLRANMQPLIGQRLDLYVDVLNALAVRTPTSLGQEEGRDFGVVRSRLDPFRIRLGMNYRF